LEKIRKFRDKLEEFCNQKKKERKRVFESSFMAKNWRNQIENEQVFKKKNLVYALYVLFFSKFPSNKKIKNAKFNN
jgi:hypothetical protein